MAQEANDKLLNSYAMSKLVFMQKLRNKLPPPNLLVTFEAAGRQLSFTKAASELNVSRVAVSQQIKALEVFLGVPLFQRLQRSVRLTRGEKGITSPSRRRLNGRFARRWKLAGVPTPTSSMLAPHRVS
jgi:biotin operon repressor